MVCDEEGTLRPSLDEAARTFCDADDDDEGRLGPSLEGALRWYLAFVDWEGSWASAVGFFG